VHDQSITAISTNDRGSINTQTIICAHQRRVLLATQCRPGDRNDVIVPATPRRTCSTAALSSAAPDTAASRRSPPRAATQLTGSFATATTPTSEPASNTSSPNSKTHKCCANPAEGDAITHSLRITAGLWNLKANKQLRVHS